MAVLQQYYTSLHDAAHSGFGVIGASAGITPEMETQIGRLISYEAPNGMDERDWASHPIALRYLSINPTQSILLCSQSCEPDSTGRVGNYFAHSLIVPPDDFLRTNFAPIFAWHSPFWKRQDHSGQSVLPTLPTLDTKQAFDVKQISGFLAEGARAGQFYKLLAAVIASSKTLRRVIIRDSDDHVALWVAALTLALPPAYRPLLSFATYHQAPYQAPFMVIGTHPLAFTPSASDNFRYFILDSETGAMGDVEDSKYARRAANLLAQNVAHPDLQDMFRKAATRFPRPTQINAQLDQIADYVEVLQPERKERLTSSQLESVHQPRQTFEQSPTFVEEDRQELHHLTDVLGKEVYAQPTPAVVNEYAETLRVLARRDKRAIERVPTDLLTVTKLLMERDQTKLQSGIDLIKKLRNEIFKDQWTEFRQKINSPDYLRQLTTQVQGAQAWQLASIWNFIGRHLDAGKQCQGILIASLRAASASGDGAMPADEIELFRVMREVMRGGPRQEPHATAWLQVAVDCTQQVPAQALSEFYYLTILGGLPGEGGLSLDERVPNRRVFQQVNPNILDAEITNDLGEALGKPDDAAVLALLEAWTRHLQGQRLNASQKLGFALDELARMSRERYSALTEKMLLSPTLKQAMPEEHKRRLLKLIFDRLSFSSVTPEQVQVCREYRAAASQMSNSDQIDILIVGVLAMSDHTLDRNAAIKLQRRFIQYNQQSYQEELHKFAAEFFDARVSGDAHGQMVFAVYRWDYRDIFWQIYWLYFKQMLLTPQSAELAVRILGFWFDRSLSDLNDPKALAYVIQGFFLGMSDAVSDIRKEREFRQTADNISRLASRKEWFPLVQDIFTVERGGIFSSIPRLFGR